MFFNKSTKDVNNDNQQKPLSDNAAFIKAMNKFCASISFYRMAPS